MDWRDRRSSIARGGSFRQPSRVTRPFHRQGSLNRLLSRRSSSPKEPLRPLSLSSSTSSSHVRLPGSETLQQKPLKNCKSESVSEPEFRLKKIDVDSEYDILQKIGEGWFSQVYLSEHRSSRQELVLKAMYSSKVTQEDFLREYRFSLQFSSHTNILTVLDVAFETKDYYMFATEYAPLGDLTSNVIPERGIGESNTKKVANQISSALKWIHSHNYVHCDVKLDNILIFSSDFNLVKLCDFGSLRTSGDDVVKKNELLSYCSPELCQKRGNEVYQVQGTHDIFQFGIVVYFCLFGVLPWQKAEISSDPNFSEFYFWRLKKTSKIPKNFKALNARGLKFFRKLLDPDPCRRLSLSDIYKYTGDKWRRKSLPGDVTIPSDEISTLTMGSFQSVHSNLEEKNKILFTLLQHGVETTVDRSQKNSRIIHWIQSGEKYELPLQNS